MEPSKIYGGNEECQSCESGWTMYIGSPIQGQDGEFDDTQSEADDAKEEYGGLRPHEAEAEADDSDDSMASDASSGPSHLYGNMHVGEEEQGNRWLDKKQKSILMEKKHQQQQQKQKITLGFEMEKKQQKEEDQTTASKGKGASTAIPSSKVRKWGKQSKN